MTAQPNQTRTDTPDPRDALMYAVLYAIDQMDVAQDQIGGGRIKPDVEAASDILDGLKDELRALVKPFFAHRLAGDPLPHDEYGHSILDAPCYLPLYTDGRPPYDRVEIRSGTVAHNWHRPPGYVDWEPIDWVRLYADTDDDLGRYSEPDPELGPDANRVERRKSGPSSTMPSWRWLRSVPDPDDDLGLN